MYCMRKVLSTQATYFNTSNNNHISIVNIYQHQIKAIWEHIPTDKIINLEKKALCMKIRMQHFTNVHVLNSIQTYYINVQNAVFNIIYKQNENIKITITCFLYTYMCRCV